MEGSIFAVFQDDVQSFWCLHKSLVLDNIRVIQVFQQVYLKHNDPEFALG